MFSDYYTLSMPSNGPTPIITFVPPSRFDERGRQMQFLESDVQRQERLAFLKASKTGKYSWSSFSDTSSGRTSPTSSIRSMRSASSSTSSLSGSPTHSPFSDVLDITNTCPEPFLFYSSPLSSGSSVPSMSLFSSAPLPPSSTTASAAGNSSFKRGHRRQSSSLHGLHAIPEED